MTCTPLSRARWSTLVLGLALAVTGARSAQAQCPWGSIQSRVQPNVSTPWTQSLGIASGQSFRVGGFYNGTGFLDTSGSVGLQLSGPNGYVVYPGNGTFVTVPYGGTYTLRAYCGALNDYATINVSGGCTYQSIQVRVQPDVSTPWTPTLALQAGQSFRVGGFYNATGLLAPSGIALRVIGPGGFDQAPANGSYVTTTQSGTYTLTGTCGTLSGSATVTASASAGTNGRRFHYGIGVAWDGPPGLTIQGKDAWNQASMDAIAAAGGTATHPSFDWVAIETTRGSYDWSRADKQVEFAERHGLEMFAYTGQTPDWAKAYPTLPSHRTPPAEQYAADFMRFHRDLAAHYCGRVKYYHFWNEPNGCSWINEGCSNGQMAATYAPWLTRWYQAMKQGCSDVVLAAGALDCAWDNNPGAPAEHCTNWLRDLYAAGAGGSFDAVAIHPYGQGAKGGVPTEANALNWPAIQGVRQVMLDNNQGSKPLWLDEWGFQTHDPNLQALKSRATERALTDLASYPYVFEARYLTLTDPPGEPDWGLATGLVQGSGSNVSVSFTPRPAWFGFRNRALGINTTFIPEQNPGFEYQGTAPPASRMPNWGPAGAWAYHRDFARPGSEVLGRKFGYYAAGTSETVGQVLTTTFAARTVYRFRASVHGGGDNTGTLPMEIGYQDTAGAFVLLSRGLVSVGASWADTSGITRTTGTTGAELGRPIWVRLGSGGVSDVWFDNFQVTSTPAP